MSDELPEMKPLFALGTHTPRTDEHGGVTIKEEPNVALASCAARLGQEALLRDRLVPFVGGDLPGPGAMTAADIGVFWMSPDQWMLMAPHDTHEDLASRVVSVVDGAASITEQNDAWCCLDVKGPNLASVFELLCPVNLRACIGKEATRTSIDHLGCFLLVMDREHVRLLGPRSSAGSLYHAVLTAMRAAL